MKYSLIYDEMMRIAALPRHEALEAIPDFLEWLSGGDEEIDSSVDFDYLQDRFRELIEECRFPRFYNEDACRRFIDDVKSDPTYQDVKAQYGSQVANMIEKAGKMQAEAMPKYYEWLLNNGLNLVINNLGTRDRLLRECLEFEIWRRGSGKEYAQMIEIAKKIKSKCAIYRAKKRYLEARVILSGGNTAKSERLIGESIELLAQDWAEIFPNTDPPDIKDVV